MLVLICRYLGYFNSQPHEEADIDFLNTRGRSVHFNSQPHEEADQTG